MEKLGSVGPNKQSFNLEWPHYNYIMIMDVFSYMHVSPVIEEHHELGKDPFAFQSLVLGPVDKVHHTQPLQTQLKHESKIN